jgi:3-hydroxy acid dehydrogenase/malonic semialdehyde reductase
MDSKKVALITGATSGIGRATAKRLYNLGYAVIITGRRAERLKQWSEGKDDILCLKFDVRNEEEVNSAIESLSDEWKNIDILVNNAGLALGLSRFYDGDSSHWNTMLDTNVKGLLYVSKAVGRIMKEQERGHIVNIGSIAGKEVYDNGNVYCASKYAVDALNKAMRYELSEFGVRVTAIHPGAVETEFSEVRFEGDKEKADLVYKGFENLVADDIADAIEYCVTRKSHVNINDLVIMPQAQPVASVIHRKKD